MSKVDKDNQRDLLGGGQEGDDLYMKRGRRAPVITKKNFCLFFFVLFSNLRFHLHTAPFISQKEKKTKRI